MLGLEPLDNNKLSHITDEIAPQVRALNNLVSARRKGRISTLCLSGMARRTGSGKP